MRFVFVLVLAGCSGSAPATGDADPGGGGGGLPTPRCGEGTCRSCVGCSLGAGNCFGSQVDFALGIGGCVASASGNVNAYVGTADVAASGAGVVTGAYVEIAARAADGSTIALIAPGEVGTYDCATLGFPGAIAYYAPDGTLYTNRPISNRPACSIRIDAVGNVGESIRGAFTATVTGPTTIDLANGTFDVLRSAYP
jgi:hypothetical protein